MADVARIRTIKPGFFRSLTLAELPKATRLTFVGLWTFVDDDGRGVDDARLVKAELWPLDDDYTVKKVEGDLVALAAAGLVLRYEVEGRRYLAITSWREHQRINRPQPSTIPPPLVSELSVNVHGTFTAGSGREGKGREGKGSTRPTESEDHQAQPEGGRSLTQDGYHDPVAGLAAVMRARGADL